VHTPVSGTLELDSLGLAPGKQASLDVFFAERHYFDSHFRLETTIPLGSDPKKPPPAGAGPLLWLFLLVPLPPLGLVGCWYSGLAGRIVTRQVPMTRSLQVGVYDAPTGAGLAKVALGGVAHSTGTPTSGVTYSSNAARPTAAFLAGTPTSAAAVTTTISPSAGYRAAQTTMPVQTHAVPMRFSTPAYTAATQKIGTMTTMAMPMQTYASRTVSPAQIYAPLPSSPVVEPTVSRPSPIARPNTEAADVGEQAGDEWWRRSVYHGHV
jgi:hypothetical protein